MQRRGMTLIEVIAALAMMATLLVAILTIRAGLARRRASANRQLRATTAADALLTQWWADPATFPVNRSGPIANDPALGWSTRVLPSDAVTLLGGRIIRLDIRDPAVVLSVDVVLPVVKERP